jgi:hypothetical protein
VGLTASTVEPKVPALARARLLWRVSCLDLGSKGSSLDGVLCRCADARSLSAGAT